MQRGDFDGDLSNGGIPTILLLLLHFQTYFNSPSCELRFVRYAFKKRIVTQSIQREKRCEDSSSPFFLDPSDDRCCSGCVFCICGNVWVVTGLWALSYVVYSQSHAHTQLSSRTTQQKYTSFTRLSCNNCSLHTSYSNLIHDDIYFGCAAAAQSSLLWNHPTSSLAISSSLNAARLVVLHVVGGGFRRMLWRRFRCEPHFRISQGKRMD